jgi:hypothetical protein
LPPYEPAFASPLSQVLEFGKSDVASGASAPAELYLGTSVLPNSITSGPLPAESVASNLVL